MVRVLGRNDIEIVQKRIGLIGDWVELRSGNVPGVPHRRYLACSCDTGAWDSLTAAGFGFFRAVSSHPGSGGGSTRWNGGAGGTADTGGNFQNYRAPHH